MIKSKEACSSCEYSCCGHDKVHPTERFCGMCDLCWVDLIPIKCRAFHYKRVYERRLVCYCMRVKDGEECRYYKEVEHEQTKE